MPRTSPLVMIPLVLTGCASESFASLCSVNEASLDAAQTESLQAHRDMIRAAVGWWEGRRYCGGEPVQVWFDVDLPDPLDMRLHGESCLDMTPSRWRTDGAGYLKVASDGEVYEGRVGVTAVSGSGDPEVLLDLTASDWGDDSPGEHPYAEVMRAAWPDRDLYWIAITLQIDDDGESVVFDPAAGCDNRIRKVP